MKKLAGLLIMNLLMLSTGFSQTHRHMSMELAKLVLDPESQSRQINLLVKGNVDLINQYALQNGGIVRYTVADISTIRIPVSAVADLASASFTKQMEMPGAYRSQSTVLNDTMRSVANVNKVHAGVPPLTQSFDGSSVIVGIIDSGVDFSHPDLKNSNGTTRILHLWDQTKGVAPNTPPNYGYGQEWSNTQIDAGLAASHNDQQFFGHGTHVTGITAGNGTANGKNKGVAPGADIIVVAFDFYNNTDPTYMDAVDYIFEKAQQAGKPCVINASLGDYMGSHDGQDLQSQVISNLIDQQSGRVVVAAAGNAGTIPFHLSYNVTSDTSWTWLVHNPSYPYIYFQVWADTNQFNNVDFTVGADVNSTAASFSGQLPFRDISAHLGIFKQDTLIGASGNRIAIVQSFGSIQGSAYLLEVNILPDSANYLWRWTTTGSGHFDIWKFKEGTGSPGFLNSGLPSASLVPEIVHYKLPDANSTIVSGMQCLDNVITVGNFGNRNFYYDINGNTYTDPNTIPGELALSSSWGPTRDGRIKPEITAPGGIMLSCGELSLLQVWATQPGNAPKVALGGFHFRDGGTSSSAPVVAGTAALYLQQNPTANAIAVKNAIIQCAVQDNFTGSQLPDNQWGHGKVDAFNVLTNCNTLSVAEQQGTPVGIIYPNPAAYGEVTIYFHGKMPSPESMIRICDASGRFIKEFPYLGASEQTISVNGIRAGVYAVQLSESNRHVFLNRLVIIH